MLNTKQIDFPAERSRKNKSLGPSMDVQKSFDNHTATRVDIVK